MLLKAPVRSRISLGPAVSSGSENSRAATAWVAVRSWCSGRARRNTAKAPSPSPMRLAATSAVRPRARVRLASVSSAACRRHSSVAEAW